jgi:glycosyltransferase involved in cell wall biosynthesis
MGDHNSAKTKRELVSVIIPTHNRRKLLKRAVDSVLRQTYQHFEIIIVDDASTDDTEQEVRSWCMSESRICYIRNEKNIGAAAARNRGVGAATGSYVCFLDDDDEWLPSKLALQLPLMSGYSIVGCDSIRIHKGSSRLGRIRFLFREVYRPKEAIRRIALSDIVKKNSGLSPTTIMVKIRHMKNVGGYDTSLGAAQGRDLFIRLIHRFGEGAAICTPLTIHHQEHDLGRISSSSGRMTGLWKEYQKNKHLLSDAQKRLRLMQIYLAETCLLHEKNAIKKSIFNAVRQLRPRTFPEQIYLLLLFFWVDFPQLIKKNV